MPQLKSQDKALPPHCTVLLTDRRVIFGPWPKKSFSQAIKWINNFVSSVSCSLLPFLPSLEGAGVNQDSSIGQLSVNCSASQYMEMQPQVMPKFSSSP